ncbi:MAG: hypothetical protein NZ580_04525 [Bacteroidia bacterium]|nr:hypothetical protein [Bacteroidia bacterium]MDW8236162.1 hypothetical protein [Bacteroidia bacterium]
MRAVLLLLGIWAQAQNPANQPVPYTLADRDRLIRLEERVTGIEKELALFREQYRQEIAAFREQYRQEMSSLRGEINELRSQLTRMESRSDTQFYTLLMILVGFIGFLLWDRRKALAPVEAKVAELQKDSVKLTRLVQSLREYARTHPDLAEILKRYELN